MNIQLGDCLELMKTLPDKSVDLFICDLPYGETNCKWDTIIDMSEFWKEFKRIRKSKRVACIHFCSTKFGYKLIQSWESGYKMDMVWKKRNKTGGLQSRYRPMRNHEMVYFFYEQAPKYNRDKYHKRVKSFPAKLENGKDPWGNDNIGVSVKESGFGLNFVPPNPPSVIEEGDQIDQLGMKKKYKGMPKQFEPVNPVSIVEEKDEFGWDKSVVKEKGNKVGKIGGNFEPVNPVSIVEEDEPKSMFESTKVFIGKRHHQTEKPQDILEFFLKYWSDEGDTILDPTMGSGSTGVACKKLNRKFIGFELTPKIFNVACKRLE